MVIKALTPEQISILEKYGKEYQTWISTYEGKESLKEHREHELFFKNKLSAYNIDNMQEDEFSEIYKKLWASRIWQNKDWYVQNKLLAPNGIESIKKELKKLLYSEGELVEKFNEFKSNIKGFGVSILSEILHMMFPEKYCLWNEKPKTVLPALGLAILPERYFKSQINTGEEYFECVQALNLVKKQLQKFGINDFLELDVMLWHIHEDILPDLRKQNQENDQQSEQVQKIEKPSIKIDSHSGAQFHLLQLGNMMGYLTNIADPSSQYETKKLEEVATLKEIPGFAGERDLHSARKIDVIWFGLDENPRVCFEVEHSTGISPGLSRLSQLKHLRVIFIIISSEDMRGKFEREVEKYPYRTYRDSFRFISYDELGKLSESSVPFFELKTKLMGQDI